MNYFEPQFWDNERRLLGEAFTDLTMRILLSGADNGLGDLPAETAVYMDWDVFNEAALDWMHGYLGSGNAQGVPVSSGAFQWAQNLTNTTRNRVVREIDTWIRDGDALPVLEARLTPLFGERRARNVAVTEVTRVYAAGNLMSWKSTGLVSGKRWMTAVDERVCPICGPLHNTITGVDDTWQFTREMIEANPQLVRIMKQPQAIMLPPAHVLCRCWLQPVIFEAYDPDELVEQFFNDPPISVLPPQQSGGRPRGIPVSDALQIPSRGKYSQRYQAALDAIDSVHGDGDLPKIPIKTQSNMSALGQYRYYSSSGISVDIQINGKGSHHEATIIHEVGHFLDHQVLGQSGQYASVNEQSKEWVDWRSAITRSDAFQTLIDKMKNPMNYPVESSYTSPIGGTRKYTSYPNGKHLEYLLSDEELWARSYTQYIVEKTGNKTMKEQLSKEREDKLHGERQWQDDDFKPISDAIDALFKSKGWIE